MRSLCLVFFVAVGLLCAENSYAAPEKRTDAAREQLRRMQQALRKAEQEKAGLVQERDALGQEKVKAEEALKEAQGEATNVRRALGAANQRAGRAERELQSSRAENEALAAKLADSEKRLAELAAKQQATASELGGSQAEERRLQQSLARQTEETKSCEAKNVALFQHGEALLERYESKGVLDALLTAEPFTGIKRVEMENVLQEYRDKLEGQKLQARERAGEAGPSIAQ